MEHATDPAAPGTVTIEDNDSSPAVTIGDVTVDEGAGTAAVPVTYRCTKFCRYSS